MREGYSGPGEGKRSLGDRFKAAWTGGSDLESMELEQRRQQQERAIAKREKLADEVQERKAQRQVNLRRDLDFYEKNGTPPDIREMLLRNSHYTFDEEGTADYQTFKQWQAEKKVQELAVPTDTDAEIIPFPKQNVEGDEEDVA